MAKFSYTVINARSQQLSGTINAPDIKTAKEELRHLGLSVIAIEEAKVDESEKTDGKESFDFEAFDSMGRKVLGKIRETDREKAFSRLKSEYGFDVLSLYKSGLSEAQIAKEKKNGLSDLQKNFEGSLAMSGDRGAEVAALEFANEQQALQRKIEFVLKKVSKFMETFASELKDEVKRDLLDQMEKIKVLKASTNFAHVQNLCEKLLSKLQDGEIYKSKNRFLKEKVEISLESKRLIGSLHSRAEISENSGVRMSVGTSWNFFNSISKTFDSWFHSDPRILALKEQIREINVNLFDYFKLYFQANETEKQEIKKRVSELFEKKRKLKQEISEIRSAGVSSENSIVEIELTFNDFVYDFTGKVLIFYLLYYFVANWLVAKDLIDNLHPIFFFHERSFLKYSLPIFFLFHIYAAVAKLFLRGVNQIYELLGFAFVCFASLLLIFNF
jgi:hypothetical protein